MRSLELLALVVDPVARLLWRAARLRQRAWTLARRARLAHVRADELEDLAIRKDGERR